MKVILPMLITHCNTKHKQVDCWHLFSEKNLIARKLFLFKCNICKKNIAVLEQYNNKTNKYYRTQYVGTEYENIIKKFNDNLFFKESKFKIPKSKNTYKWVYGINEAVYDVKTGEIAGVKNYACDFYGNKIEI